MPTKPEVTRHEDGILEMVGYHEGARFRYWSDDGTTWHRNRDAVPKPPDPDSREGRFRTIVGRRSPSPPARYVVAVDADGGQGYEFHDDFAEAEAAYDGIRIWDLDTGQQWDVERSQRAIPAK